MSKKIASRDPVLRRAWRAFIAAHEAGRRAVAPNRLLTVILNNKGRPIGTAPVAILLG